jgi:hypothetical protein
MTIPTPTDTTAGRVVYVNNVGTVDFMIDGSHIASGHGRQFIWTGSAWSSQFFNPGSGTQIKTASTTQTITNSAVLASSTELTFFIGANETVVFQYSLLVTNSNNAGPDWKAAIKAPTGSTCSVTQSGIEPAGAAFPQASTTDCTTPGTMVNNTIVADAGVPFQVWVSGFVTSGANSGTVALQFAENTAAGGTSISIVKGSYLQAYQTTGADVAEIYYSKDQSVESGDVVAVDSSGISQVVKADANDSTSALGIISTKPGIVLGTPDANGKPVIVGLAGRVPVKVTNENGPIKIGDFLTVSHTPGYAMRATGSGQVIGQAMTSSDTDTGTVLVFIKNTYYDGENTIQSTSTATSTTLADGSLADKFTHIVRLAFEKLTNVFLDMTLWIKNVNADKVQTKELCIDDVCVTKEQLKQMIQNSANANTSNNGPENNISPQTPEETNVSTSSISTTTESVETSTSTGSVSTSTQIESDTSITSTPTEEILQPTTEQPVLPTISQSEVQSILENNTTPSE